MGFNFDAVQQQEAEQFEGQWRTGKRTGVEFLVRPVHTPDFEKELRKLRREYRREHGLIGRKAGIAIPEDDDSDLFKAALASTLIGGWRGVEDGTGKDLAFSVGALAAGIKKSVKFKMDVYEVIDDEAEEFDSQKETIEKN